jgi:hypothetical protein
MDFGNTIPFFFMAVCCIVVTPFAGFASLAIIRFILKDKQLATNILFTVMGTGLLSFISPTVQVVLARALDLILIHLNCGCEASIGFTPEVVGRRLLSAVQDGAFLIYPGIALGFYFALCFVVPITFGVRFFKKEKATPQSGSPSQDLTQSRSNN